MAARSAVLLLLIVLNIVSNGSGYKTIRDKKKPVDVVQAFSDSFTKTVRDSPELSKIFNIRTLTPAEVKRSTRSAVYSSLTSAQISKIVALDVASEVAEIFAKSYKKIEPKCLPIAFGRKSGRALVKINVTGKQIPKLADKYICILRGSMKEFLDKKNPQTRLSVMMYAFTRFMLSQKILTDFTVERYLEYCREEIAQLVKNPCY